MTREWIKKPFKIHLLPQVVPLQATICPAKGKGAKVTVPTFPTQFLVWPKIVHQHEREVEYFKANKGMNKRKRVAKGRKQIDQAQPSQQPQQGPEQDESQDEHATQVQETEKVSPKVFFSG